MASPLVNLATMLKKVTNKNYSVFVGWKNAEYAKIAAIQEFGAIVNVTDKMRKFLHCNGIHLSPKKTTITIPPRAHRQKLIKKYGKSWEKLLAKQLEKTNFNVDKSLQKLKLQMIQDYRKLISSTGRFKKLSGATISYRQVNDIGGTRPLFATGDMERLIEGVVTSD